MKIATCWVYRLVALAGGALAAYSIRESAALDYAVATEEGVAGLLVTPQWAGSVAAVVAVTTLVVLSLARSRIGAATAALVGASLIGLPEFVSVATTPAVTVNAVGAGLLLAAAAYPAVGRRDRLMALAAGVLMATMFFGVAGVWRVTADRWAVSLGDDPYYVGSTLPVPILIGAVLLLGAVALTSQPGEPDVDSLSVTVGVVLPVSFLLLYATLGSTKAGQASWTVAVGLAVTATVVAAGRLPASTGRVLLLGLIFAAVTIRQVHYFTGAEWWLLGVLALVAGLVIGRRFPTICIWVGIAVLIAATASGLMPTGGIPGTAAVAAYALLVPGAVGLCIASAVSTVRVNSLVVLTAALLPLTVTFFAASAPTGPPDLVWSSHPESSEPGIAISSLSTSTASVVVAVVTAVTAALAVALRRSLCARAGRRLCPTPPPAP